MLEQSKPGANIAILMLCTVSDAHPHSFTFQAKLWELSKETQRVLV